MTDFNKINHQLNNKSPQEIIQWGINQGKSIISSHFGPYEAVLLHMVAQIKPDIDVIWVDNGYATNGTYRFANTLIEKLKLNVHIYAPQRTAAFLNVRYGGVPELDTTEHNEFTHFLKIEPFNRALAELKPHVWFTALRREQSALRQDLDIVSDAGNNLLKISPILNWREQDMRDYLHQHNLPNEMDYVDPTKGLQGRECGLHKIKF